jgi:hypothetical protein
LKTNLYKENNLIYLFLIAFGSVMILIALTFSPTPSQAISETGFPLYSDVKLPQNYQTAFVHYATVQRSDGTSRNIYINPEAIEAIKAGNRLLPEHTVIVIEGFYARKDSNDTYLLDNNGRYENGDAFEMLHVLEKRYDWSESDFVSENRIGDWNFGSFNMLNGNFFDESMSACFHCHNATEHTDFLYSAPLLRDFIQTGQTQFLLCDLPDRIACS